MNWNNAWGQNPTAGTLPPPAPSGPNIPSWIGGNNGYALGQGSYALGQGPYGSQTTAPNNAPTSATGRVKARELAGLFGSVGTKALGNTALTSGAALAAGFAPSFDDVIGHLAGNLANPSTMTGLAGNVAAKAAGFSPPTGIMGKVAQFGINPALGVMAGMINPALGLAYGLMSPFAMDAIGDVTNTRRDEAHRDGLEDAHGTFGGRAAARDFDSMAQVGGFGSLGKMAKDYGYGPADLARGMSNRDASKAMSGRNPSGSSYGGFGAVGGPVGGARAVDSGYGRSMGGYAGLGIGNPSSHGGGGNGSGGGPGRGGRGDSTGTGGGYSDGKGGVSGL